MSTDALTATRRNDGFLEVSLGPLRLIMRPSDGWIDATSLAKSAGKRVVQWTGSKSTVRRLRLLVPMIHCPMTGTKLLIKRLEEEIGGPVIETIHGNEGRTWMHVKLATKFEQWLSAPRTAKMDRGTVYLVSSPILNGFKVGIWTGSIQSLRSRYSTYYGPSLNLLVWEDVENHRDVESLVLSYFKAHSLGGELLDLKVFEQCKRFIEELTV